MIENEVLVLCCGQKFHAYVDKVQLYGEYLHDLYVQLSKPPTKPELTQLHVCENNLNWLLDASWNACNVSHVNFDVPEGYVMDHLEKHDLKGCKFPFPAMREQLLWLYSNLPTAKWSQFPQAVNSDGSVNKNYAVLYLYCVYATPSFTFERLSIKNEPKRCPLVCLEEEVVQFINNFTAAVVAARCWQQKLSLTQ